MNGTLNGKHSHANGHAPAAAAARPTYRIEVFSKPGFSDPAGAAILAQLPLIGITSVQEVRTGIVYELTGPLSLSQATTAASRLFADPVTQDFFIHHDKMTPSQLGPHWRIEVGLKPSVLDPIAESVIAGMSDLGLPAPETVRSASVYKLMGRLGQAQAEKIVSKLLVNPVIHRFSMEPC